MNTPRTTSEDDTVDQMLVVRSKMGIHARPAAMIVRLTNKFAGEVEFACSQPLLFRPLLGMLNFDVEKLRQLGFTKFKILRSKGKTGF